jgi:hypothetical protein
VFQNYENGKTYEYSRDLIIVPPTCTDNFDANCSVEKVSSFNYSKLGNQTIVYKATDSSGNTSELVLEVTIVDTTKPSITLIGPREVVLEWKESFIDPGISYSDNFDDELDVRVGVFAVDWTNPKILGYRYSVTDSSGNRNSIDRIVYRKSVDTLDEVYFSQSYDFAFSTSDGYIFVSPSSEILFPGGVKNKANEVIITDKLLNIIFQFRYEGENHFRIQDAKLFNSKLYLGGSNIRSNAQLDIPNHAIKVYDFSGILLDEITLPTTLESFDVFENGDIIYTSFVEQDGAVFRIDSAGEIIEAHEFKELSGYRKETIVASNGNVFFSMVNQNNSGEGSPGVFIFNSETKQLTQLLSGQFYNIKQIGNNVVAVGKTIVLFDLNGNQIKISDPLTDRREAPFTDVNRPFTNVVAFQDGYLVSGYREKIFYLNSDLEVVWGYQTISTLNDIGRTFYSHAILVEQNKIILSGVLSDKATSQGDGLISILIYD